MIIEIKDELLARLINFLENENLTLYNELKEIKPLDMNSLEKARKVKTQKVKDILKVTIKEILKDKQQNLTKYQVHKRTKVAYVTINKYFDEILEEIKKEIA